MQFRWLHDSELVKHSATGAFQVLRDLSLGQTPPSTFVPPLSKVALPPERPPASVLTIIQCAGLLGPQHLCLFSELSSQGLCFQSFPEPSRTRHSGIQAASPSLRVKKTRRGFGGVDYVDCSSRTETAVHVRSVGYPDFDPWHTLDFSHPNGHLSKHQYSRRKHH